MQIAICFKEDMSIDSHNLFKLKKMYLPIVWLTVSSSAKIKWKIKEINYIKYVIAKIQFYKLKSCLCVFFSFH